MLVLIFVDFDKIFAKKGAGIATKYRRNMLKKLLELFFSKKALFVTKSAQKLVFFGLYHKR